MESVHPHARRPPLARLADARAVDLSWSAAAPPGWAAPSTPRRGPFGAAGGLRRRHQLCASTKLIHGGVRYLAQGRIGLVRAKPCASARRLLRNAPALAHPARFVVPARNLAERLLLRVGLGAYEALAGRDGCVDASLFRRGWQCHALPGLREEAGRRRGFRRCPVRRRRPGARALAARRAPTVRCCSTTAPRTSWWWKTVGRAAGGARGRGW